jgi:hypothetical protein
VTECPNGIKKLQHAPMTQILYNVLQRALLETRLHNVIHSRDAQRAQSVMHQLQRVIY